MPSIGPKLTIGQRYSYTYPAYRDPNTGFTAPACTVTFTITGEDAGTYHLLHDNGSPNKFSKASPFHRGCQPAA